MSRFVLDCSVAISWCLSDETNDYAEQVLQSLEAIEAVVPQIWALEVANTFLVAERRSRMTLAQTTRALELLKSLPITIDNQTAVRAMENTLSLGRLKNLSAYDSSYLELATREGIPLATLDSKLAQAARNDGITLYLI